MPETSKHKKAKRKAAGKSGRTEVALKGKKRLDAATRKTATEIEYSGTMDGLVRAARRLKASWKPRKVLQVPQKDLSKAAEAMRKAGVSGTVKNISGTKRRSIPKKK